MLHHAVCEALFEVREILYLLLRSRDWVICVSTVVLLDHRVVSVLPVLVASQLLRCFAMKPLWSAWTRARCLGARSSALAAC